MSENAPDAAPARRPFAAFVQEQRNGGLHGELSDALIELVNAVHDHNKPGTLQLTLKVAPNKDGMTVTVTDKIKLTTPEGERGAADRYKLTARLRFRLNGGRLTLGYLLDRPESIKRDALEGVADRIATKFERTYVGEAPTA